MGAHGSSPWAEGPRADKSPPAFLRFLLPSGGSKWTPYWITFGLPPTRIDRHPGRGNANSNPASAGRESTANPTSSKRRPGQPRSFETGAGERMHTFPSATSVSISSSICDNYTVSWLATHRVARRGDNALLYAIGRASPHYGPPPGVAMRPPWSIGFKRPTNRHPGGGTSVPATRRPAFEGQSSIGSPASVRDP